MTLGPVLGLIRWLDLFILQNILVKVSCKKSAKLNISKSVYEIFNFALEFKHKVVCFVCAFIDIRPSKFFYKAFKQIKRLRSALWDQDKCQSGEALVQFRLIQSRPVFSQLWALFVPKIITEIVHFLDFVKNIDHAKIMLIEYRLISLRNALIL